MTEYYSQIMPADIKNLLYEYLPSYRYNEYKKVPGMGNIVQKGVFDDDMIEAIYKNDIEYVCKEINKIKKGHISDFIPSGHFKHCVRLGLVEIIQYFADDALEYFNQAMKLMQMKKGGYLIECNDNATTLLLYKLYRSNYYIEDMCRFLRKNLSKNDLSLMDWFYRTMNIYDYSDITLETVLHGQFNILSLNRQTILIKHLCKGKNRKVLEWLSNRGYSEEISECIDYYKVHNTLPDRYI